MDNEGGAFMPTHQQGFQDGPSVWWWALQHPLTPLLVPPAFCTWTILRFKGRGPLYSLVCALLVGASACLAGADANDDGAIHVALQVAICFYGGSAEWGAGHVARGATAAALGALVWICMSQHLLQEAALGMAALGVGLVARAVAPARYANAALAAGVACGAAVAGPCARHVFPIAEMSRSFSTLSTFAASPADFSKRTARLLLVAANCQIPLGLLGIHYLRSQQARRLLLVDVGEQKVTARAFTKAVFRFVAVVAVPYMLQRIAIEVLHYNEYGLYKAGVENDFRVALLFENGDTQNLAIVGRSNFTTDATAASLLTVVDNNFRMVEAKVSGASGWRRTKSRMARRRRQAGACWLHCRAHPLFPWVGCRSVVWL